jgi:hypothetical protein
MISKKIIGRIKIFEKCTSDAVAHGVRLLPPHRTALRSCRRGERRQESNSCANAASTVPGTCRRAARRRPLTSCHTAAGFFKEVFGFFSLNDQKSIASIIRREYRNHRRRNSHKRIYIITK